MSRGCSPHRPGHLGIASTTRTSPRRAFNPAWCSAGRARSTCFALVAAGVGLTRLPLSASTRRDGGVAFVPLTGELAQVALVTPPGDDNPMLEALRDVLLAVRRELGAPA